jgi:hypothetical protein
MDSENADEAGQARWKVSADVSVEGYLPSGIG